MKTDTPEDRLTKALLLLMSAAGCEKDYALTVSGEIMSRISERPADDQENLCKKMAFFLLDGIDGVTVVELD